MLQRTKGIRTWVDADGANPQIVAFDENEDRQRLREAIKEYNDQSRGR